MRIVLFLLLAVFGSADAYMVKRNGGLAGGSGGASTWHDNFNRADETPLTFSGQWTQTTFEGSGQANLVTNTVVSSANGNGAFAFWATDTPTTSSNFACATMTNGPSGYVGPCVGIDEASKDAVCCLANGAGIEMHYWDNSATSTLVAAYPNPPTTYQAGDYIAIVRSATNQFRCYYSNAGAAWTALGSGVETLGVTTTDPGRTGLFTATTSWTMNAWGGGNGTTLPAAATCAPNS